VGQANVQAIYLQHSQEIERFLVRRLACRETAADLTQETFARLLRAGTTEQIENVRAYLFRTAANLALDHLRRRKHMSVPADDGELERVADTRPGQEQGLLSRQALARLQAAVNTLPDRQREVFRLHKVDGLSYQEIADRLGIAKNTVMVHMVRALAHCRAALDDGDGEGTGA
jgi:RNA polymerase sigma-70 factor (ECF subfamily)